MKTIQQQINEFADTLQNDIERERLLKKLELQKKSISECLKSSEFYSEYINLLDYKITEIEKKQMKKYYQRAVDIFSSIGKANKQIAENKILEIYKFLGVTKEPIITWCESPVDYIQKYAEDNDSVVDENQIESDCEHGQFDVFWMGFYHIFEECFKQKFGEKNKKEWSIYESLYRNCSLWYPYENTCYIIEKPIEAHLEVKYPFYFQREHIWDIYQLHNEDGPAIKYKDGYGLYYYKGNRMIAN